MGFNSSSEHVLEQLFLMGTKERYFFSGSVYFKLLYCTPCIVAIVKISTHTPPDPTGNQDFATRALFIPISFISCR